MYPVVFVVAVDLLHPELRSGDHVVFDPSTSPRPMRCQRAGAATLCTEIPNVGAVLGAIADDIIIPLTTCPPLQDLARAVGCDWLPTPPERPAVPSGPPLRLLQ